MSCVNSVLVIVALACFPLSRASDVFSSALLYDWGFYGIFPRTWYKSFHLASPLLNFLRWDERCDDGYYLLSPRGSYVWNPSPVIVDARGNLVWTDDRYGMVTDVKIQLYKGNRYLTFWSGKDGALHGYGKGVYYMLDETYQVFKTIEAIGNGMSGDLHEFKITDEGTALVTVYHPVPADLSSVGGPVEGWLLESIFQEIDIETASLMFEWRASNHVPINFTAHPFGGSDDGLSPQYAFDFFHINSIDKDDGGNYVISTRHTNTIMSINPTGDIVWVLGGGGHNMFRDLSGGRATDFRYQHHARLHGNSTLSIFDNAKSERDSGAHSRGMLISLDTRNMTALLLREFTDPNHQLSASQGSAQLLEDNGNMLLGYGFLPSFAEFAPDGQLLCDARFAPWVISRIGMVTSYRAFKSKDWTGRPSHPPSIYLKPSDRRLYASWNGATEVDRWVLQGGGWEHAHRGQYADIASKEKLGFETAFDLGPGTPAYLRVAAVARDGRALGHSELVSRTVGNAPSTLVRDLLATASVCLVVLAAALAYRKRLLRAARACSGRRLPGAVLVVLARWRNWRRQGGNAKTYELEPLYRD